MACGQLDQWSCSLFRTGFIAFFFGIYFSGCFSPCLIEYAALVNMEYCVAGSHEHVIKGYTLLKGIGDGEPIASEKFVVGGHEWVGLGYGCGSSKCWRLDLKSSFAY